MYANVNLMIFGSIAAFILSAVGLHVAAEVPADEKDFFFNENPQFMMWMMLISVLMSVALGLIAPVFRRIGYICSHHKLTNRTRNRHYMLGALFFVFAMVPFLFSPYSTTPPEIMDAQEVLLRYPRLVTLSTMLISAVVPAMCISGMLLINYCMNTRFKKEHIRSITSIENNLVREFISLRSLLDFFLVVIGVFVAASVFTSGTLRQAVVATEINVDFSVFPIEFVYFFGGYFTFLIATVYIPVYSRVQRVGKGISAQLNPMNGELSAWVKQQDELETSLQVKQSPIKRIQIALSILAPASGALLSQILSAG